MTPTAKPVSPWTSKESLIALLLGGVLGQLVSLMALHRPGDMFAFAMAIVCVLSGAASLVVAMLASPAASKQVRADRIAHVPVWLLAIGAGLLAVLRYSPF